MQLFHEIVSLQISAEFAYLTQISFTNWTFKFFNNDSTASIYLSAPPVKMENLR